MSLRINNVSLRNFRSYEYFELNDLGKTTVFVGPNAVGKTNLIEAIQLVSSMDSFRGSSVRELLKNGCSESKICAKLSDEYRQLSLSVDIFSQNKKYSLNGKPKRVADLKGLLPSVVFSPDDLMLIKGSQSLKRKALDELGGQLNPNYYSICKDFEKLLRHKNKLLKDEAQAGLIDAVNEVFAKVGSELVAYRSALFARLQKNLTEVYGQISQYKNVLACEYVPSWLKNLDIEGAEIGIPEPISREVAYKELTEALAANLQREIAAKRTFIGPNHDDVNFYLDGLDARTFASQGQQRSLVLSWKIAEVNTIKDMMDTTPLLLLDDVMSELDESRRNSLMQLIDGEMQVFITTANLDYFNDQTINNAKMVFLEN